MKILLLLIFVLSGSNVFSKELPVVAFFMNYDCPHCKRVNENKEYLEQACIGSNGKKKCRIEYYPLTDNKNDARSPIYYMSRKLPEDHSQKISDVFYMMADSGAISKKEATALLQAMVPEIDWAVIVEKYYESLGVPAHVRALKLALKAGVRDYPSFVYLDKSKISLIGMPLNPEERLSAIIKFVRDDI